jgi:hydrogenase/urease accessory protein HupE
MLVRMAIARGVSCRTWLGLTTAVGVAACIARPAACHPFAASAFDAVTEGRDLYVHFRLDATSVVDMLNRTAGGRELIGKDGIELHQQAIFDYVVARFSVRNQDSACPARPAGVPRLDEASNKVILAALYSCAQELDVLTLDSTLFAEETTPHQIIGTFRHRRALENYLLSKSVSQAVIRVRRLAQLGPAEATRPGEFRIVPPPPGTLVGAGNPVRGGVARPMGSGVGTFFLQGILHILGGLDHVLFVIALVSVVTTWTELAKVVTSFTVAHSITLALGALDMVKISPRLVEPLIAMSIMYVGLENVLRARPRARLAVTFSFGLMHGFGFSGVLRDLGLPRAHLAPALLGFNLGVEVGQLLIVAPLAPLVWLLQRRAGAFRRFRIGVNAAVALVAGWWFIERVFKIGP